jgi:hypothetical protein
MNSEIKGIIIIVCIIFIILSGITIVSVIKISNRESKIFCHYRYDTSPEMTMNQIEDLDRSCDNWVFIASLCQLNSFVIVLIILMYVLQHNKENDDEKSNDSV